MMHEIPLGAWVILTVIVIYDARENRIPNKLVMLLAIFALCVAGLKSHSLVDFGRFALGGLVLFSGSLLCYVFRVMAAGDVKLLGAVGLLLGYGNLSTPMFWILMSGAGLGVMYWFLARLYVSKEVTDLALENMGSSGKALGSLTPPQFREFANTKMPFAPAVAVGLAIYSYLH